MSDTTPASQAQAPRKSARGGKPRRAARPVHPLLQRLWELHPQLFGTRFVPLKRGVFEDIQARHPGQFDKDQLKQALGQHVRSTRYLEAVAGGLPRHDLDGNAVEPVAPEHVQHAIVDVLRRRQGAGKEVAAPGAGSPPEAARRALDARVWALERLVAAIEASGLDQSGWSARCPSSDATTLALQADAFATLAERTARREALLRAWRASGTQDVDAFAQMYGLDARTVRQALAHEAARAAAPAAPAAPAAAPAEAPAGAPAQAAATAPAP